MRRFLWLTPFLSLGLCPLGCSQYQAVEQKTQAEENQAGIILNQLFADRINLGTFRTVVEQLNTYYDHHLGVDKKALTLTREQDEVLRQLLSEVKGDFDRARRIDDVKNKLFNTAVDASYIDSCLLFRDAYSSLVTDLGEIPPASEPAKRAAYQLEEARYLFSWVMRQVALKANPPGIKEWPAHEILRLGAGDAEDRLRVFLGLMNQTETDTAAVIVKGQERQGDTIVDRQTPILAVVLIDKKLYCFDPFTGQPVNGASGIATWDELKKNPSLLGVRPEAVTATQVANGELVSLVSINALAPRMAVLEKDFEGIKVNVKLHEDVPARLARFKQAGADVKPWAALGRSGFPGLVYHKYIEGSKGDPRLTELVIPRNKLLPEWTRQLDAQMRSNGFNIQLVTEFDKLFVNLRLEPGGGRDLLVRGRPHQAVEKISRMENRLDQSLDNFRQERGARLPMMKEFMLTKLLGWNTDLMKTRAASAGLAKGSAEERKNDLEIRKLYAQIDSSMKETNMVQICQQIASDSAMPELREHLTYFMGLAKMDLAIRAERRFRSNPQAGWPKDTATPTELYSSAAAWFGRYEAMLITMNSQQWLDAVKLRRAECLAKQTELTTLMAKIP
jgi:hypothetical protein